jgi:predicted naringenin-chalcone synthase
LSKIVSIATGTPPYKHRQEDIFSFADAVYSENEVDSRKLKFLYKHSGIATRYSSIPDYGMPINERQFYAKNKALEPFPNLEERMEWYAKNAAPLSIKTINQCIDGKINAAEITHLITVSCTGMSAPGLDLEIVESMGLSPNIFRTSINFMGCYAAIHALKLADALCSGKHNVNVLVVCTEFCTLHFQKENTIDNLTATLLFADGCAAMLVQADSSEMKGLTIDSFFSNIAFKGKKDMSWKLSSKGFLMTLSGYVPDLVKEDFDQLLGKALANAGLTKADITHWCIHPGGKKILEVIESCVNLPKKSLDYSYEVLQNFGNMSSPTILFVLQKILLELQSAPVFKKSVIFGAAFGPGLTMETFIARYD